MQRNHWLDMKKILWMVIPLVANQNLRDAYASVTSNNRTQFDMTCYS